MQQAIQQKPMTKDDVLLLAGTKQKTPHSRLKDLENVLTPATKLDPEALSAIVSVTAQALKELRGKDAPDYMRDIERRVAENIHAFDVESLSYLASGLAFLKRGDEQLWQGICRCAKVQIESLSKPPPSVDLPNVLSNLAVALKDSRYNSSDVLIAIATYMETNTNLQKFNSAQVAAILNSCAAREVIPDRLLELVKIDGTSQEKRCQRRFSCYSEEDLTSVIASVCKIIHADIRSRKNFDSLQHNTDLLEALKSEAESRVAKFNARSIAEITAAFAEINYDAEKLFRSLSKQAVKLSATFGPLEISRTLMAFAKMGIKDPNVFSRLGQRALEIDKLSNAATDAFGEQQRANTVWAFAFGAPNLIEKLCTRDHMLRADNLFAKAQMHTALIIAEQVDPSESFSFIPQLKQVSDTCFHAPLENRVVEVLLHECGINPQELTRSAWVGPVETDIIVRRGDKQLIIECDGDKFHQIYGSETGAVRGRDIIQDLLFKKCGYEVVHVSSEAVMAGSLDEFKTAVAQALA